MNSDESGHVTAERTIGSVAIILAAGVIVVVAQAGIAGTSPCQAAYEGVQATSIGQTDPQGAASAAYSPGFYEVAHTGGWAGVTGITPYRGTAGWVGGIARCLATTINEGDPP